MISAKVIADSINPYGNRLTSIEVVMPRIILAEFNTHRMISKNTGSSRAIKFEKMLEIVQKNPFIPMKFLKEHKGMQGYEYFEGQEEIVRKNKWLDARWRAMEAAENMHEFGVTKQICNRLLEPFSWVKAIATATEWENFFALRYHEAAEIHMQELAKMMLFAMNDSTPKLLKVDEWHIPYGDDITNDIIIEQLNGTEFFDEFYNNPILTKIKIATARCAGTSFTVVGDDGEIENYPKLIRRTNKLLKDGHMSPFEHCSKVSSGKRKFYQKDETASFYGNFKGWIQFRKTLTGENRTDNRLIKIY